MISGRYIKESGILGFKEGLCEVHPSTVPQVQTANNTLDNSINDLISSLFPTNFGFSRIRQHEELEHPPQSHPNGKYSSLLPPPETPSALSSGKCLLPDLHLHCTLVQKKIHAPCHLTTYPAPNSRFSPPLPLTDPSRSSRSSAPFPRSRKTPTGRSPSLPAPGSCRVSTGRDGPYPLGPSRGMSSTSSRRSRTIERCPKRW